MPVPVLITVASLELLKSGSVNPPALFLFFKIVLVFGPFTSVCLQGQSVGDPGLFLALSAL